MEGGVAMSIDQMLADPALKNLEKDAEIVTKRVEFRLFKRLFRFDIIKEGVTPPNLFEKVDICESSEQAAWLCSNKEGIEKRKAERLVQWHKEQDESFARMKKDPRIKDN